MTLKERFPRVTAARVLIVLAFATVLSLVCIVAGTRDWVYGLMGGITVSVASSLGIRWRNQDARRVDGDQKSN
jgi:uncharacterized membrane protein YfcA